ncbi:MAG TPA: hypothetical protein VH415_06185 [Nitrososphaeraceae archaeon]|jgi:hypothetical protein
MELILMETAGALSVNDFTFSTNIKYLGSTMRLRSKSERKQVPALGIKRSEALGNNDQLETKGSNYFYSELQAT